MGSSGSERDLGAGVRFTMPPPVSFRDSATSSIVSGSSTQDKHDVMVKYLHRKVGNSKWLEPPEGEYGVIDGGASNLGVLLRRPDGIYTAEPMFMNPDIVKAVERLGVTAAFTMSSEITQALLNQTTPFQTEIPLDPRGVALPIVDSVKSIATGKCTVTRDAYICLCRAEKFVLVWGDTAQGILAHGTDVENRLLGIVWGEQVATPDTQLSPYRTSLAPTRQSTLRMHSGIPSGYHTPDDPIISEKVGVIQAAIKREEEGDQAFDPEKDGDAPPKRQMLLTHAVIIGLAMVLVVVVEMACLAKLITEVRLDGSMIRFALVATIPLFAMFSLFFMIVITGSAFQLFFPLSGLSGNSIFYSAKPPIIARHKNYELPHITIQMPVYKEGLKGVIIPTVTSLLAAVRHYEEQGGTVSIYVNDDGMQIVKPELQEARKAFYEINSIGWCSRPGHCDKEINEGDVVFLRKGQFKKASNMNYCLDFSIRVEDELLRLIEATCRERGCTSEELSVEEEEELYGKALNAMIESDEGRTWAAGNVRLGEIILIIDSDTRVPEDCLIFGALEMYESPEVALIQHASGILQVVNNVFENGITYFTNLIYTSIQFAVGNGDCAPFVGHNTFIRWKAIQSISFQEDGQTKFWSESHVSEDFDVSLRLQMAGFIVRLAAYHNGGFKEGVSLTVYDELARWEKYAYGCNELVFNPLLKWPIKGPFTRLFLRFMFSNIKITSKITILAYIGTYYAIASAIPLTLANYLIVGWFGDNVDQFYITSWKIFVGMAVIFNVVSPLAYAMLRHRLGQKTFFMSLLETMKWTPMFLLFFGGLSYHLLKAIACHFFSIRMEWTTTAKELEESGFRAGLDRIVQDFKYMYLIIVPMTGGIIYLAQYAPRAWEIKDFAAIVPLANQIGCHALLPFALGLF
ncbi:hypothetical protein P152DRAFT_515290 [Eremomyces bilateralis CBS 781.70]|uniref:Glycosyltransferase 2-like domain-containing protein n=1 Tax=Eremomyces bilateralis CBS 781.70 TaxID=1392243 RepID=A0A6G1G029_9PEZI|nr:uncharacterized protein P152DRAFT_515290 [Eremomyces bilateralis CBS 781.70]KAF1811332.1 hypothetical protein P152DRAFT_515290 [Eremomyces bilateralis CBS 781.70]